MTDTKIIHRHLDSYEATENVKKEVLSIVNHKSARVDGFYIRLKGDRCVAIGKRQNRINDLVSIVHNISDFARLHKRKIPTAFHFVTVSS